MSEVLILCEKYGQITRVSVDGKFCYPSGNTPTKEAEHIKALLDMMVIENYKVEVK